ncbi:MAG: hypothetical protein AAFY78_10040 [Cyanobacteria bacterium J06648_16]
MRPPLRITFPRPMIVGLVGWVCIALGSLSLTQLFLYSAHLSQGRPHQFTGRNHTPAGSLLQADHRGSGRTQPEFTRQAYRGSGRLSSVAHRGSGRISLEMAYRGSGRLSA